MMSLAKKKTKARGWRVCAYSKACAVCLLAGAMLCSVNAAAAGQDLLPTDDAQVIEVLAPRVLPSPIATGVTLTPEAAAVAARLAIVQARATADPRYLGRAQAVLAPWWDQAEAPVALAILQATVQQARHEFTAAHATLTRALQRDPTQAQGWLTLATLERLAGRYPQALTACAQVERAGAGLYAKACSLETRSMQGQHDAARQGFEALRRQSADIATQAWLLSLLAESEERAGRDAAAWRAYQTSLALAPDGYTALAAADMLLRTGRAPAALALLADQPASDAVLLRRAQALKLAKNPAWQSLATTLRERFAELEARGDDPAAHARERAIGWLWLDGDVARAAASARLNLQRQKEPLDWWLALHSADLAGQTGEVTVLRDALAATGLSDARLTRWAGGKP